MRLYRICKKGIHAEARRHNTQRALRNMTENENSFKIIGAAIELHKKLGPGLLESVYENAFAYDLREISLKILQQVPMPLIYKKLKWKRVSDLTCLLKTK